MTPVITISGGNSGRLAYPDHKNTRKTLTPQSGHSIGVSANKLPAQYVVGVRDKIAPRGVVIAR